MAQSRKAPDTQVVKRYRIVTEPGHSPASEPASEVISTLIGAFAKIQSKGGRLRWHCRKWKSG